MQSTSCKTPCWINHKLGIKIARININCFRYADDTTLDKGERGVKKLAWNSTFKKLRSWHLVPSLHGKLREKSEAVTDFFSLGSKITVTVTAALKLKSNYSFEGKLLTNLDKHIKKQRHYFVDKGLSSQSYGFPSSHVWMWIIKKADRWRTDAFEQSCWRRLLRVPWITRRSNQFILKEISPEYSLEELVLKLKIQYLGHLMWRTDSLEMTLMLVKIEGRKTKGK